MILLADLALRKSSILFDPVEEEAGPAGDSGEAWRAAWRRVRDDASELPHAINLTLHGPAAVPHACAALHTLLVEHADLGVADEAAHQRLALSLAQHVHPGVAREPGKCGCNKKKK